MTDDSILCHERLAIVGVDSGAQPLTNQDGSIILAVNGEIYNHKALRKSLKEPAVFKTHSDCEVIMHLVRLVSPLSIPSFLPSIVPRELTAWHAWNSTKNMEPLSALNWTECFPSSSSIHPSLPLA